MSGKIKVAGTWRTTPNVYTKVGSTWKAVSRGYTKIGGVWRLWFIQPIVDTFTRTTAAGNLGSTDTGTAWTVLRGSWYSNGTQAIESASTATTYPLAAVDLSVSDVIVSASTPLSTCAGLGVNFWTVDANNWWAAIVYSDSYSYSYATTCTSCYSCSVCTGTGCTGLCGNAVADPNNCGCCSSICCLPDSCCGTDAYGNCICISYGPCFSCCSSFTCAGSCGTGKADTNNCGCCNTTSTCCSSVACTGTAIGYNYYVRLVSSVAGTITTIQTSTATGTVPTSIAVSTLGNVITATIYSGATSIATTTYTATSPNKGTKVGILKGYAASNQGTALDNFSAAAN
ncbi:hypothetical protein UFOVP27_101 [uncultured Caudovirales phage]|uniref:Uncharacterized protein n=1 Tax=uncultured Caudovirales phage TaxID=2100421 RepID=A0A6J5KM36_9CAUD|nr:hypothetical protein UFOVP27_101 [uncultured Caudovirales phage]